MTWMILGILVCFLGGFSASNAYVPHRLRTSEGGTVEGGGSLWWNLLAALIFVVCAVFFFPTGLRAIVWPIAGLVGVCAKTGFLVVSTKR